MNDKDIEILKMYIVNQGLRVDGDLAEARAMFYHDETPWNAFRRALAAERKKTFDMMCNHLCILLHL